MTADDVRARAGDETRRAANVAASAQYAIARAEVEKALQARPEDERLHIALGEALAGVGEREAAVEAAERALARLPPSADALLGRELQQEAVMRVLLPAGDYDRALALLAELSGFAPVRSTARRVLTQIMTRSLESYLERFRARPSLD